MVLRLTEMCTNDFFTNFKKMVKFVNFYNLKTVGHEFSMDAELH